MARLSTTNNPTDLRDIERNRIAIDVSPGHAAREMQVIKLDFEGLQLDPELTVICIARGGNSSQRFELGTVKNWSNSRRSLNQIHSDHPLRFRLLVRTVDSHQLVASAENIRPFGSDNIESLLPMEPGDLGQRVWRLDITDTDGPILRFNQKVFPSAGGVNSFVPFSTLVLPEAVAQIFRWIVQDPVELQDETTLRGAWSTWLMALGVESPTQDDKDDEAGEWVNEATKRFVDRYGFSDSLIDYLQKSGEKS